MKKLNEFEILYTQYAMWLERNNNQQEFVGEFKHLNDILHFISLRDIENYLEKVYAGNSDKKRYYNAAKEIIGKKPSHEILKKNFLNHKNRAYLEFLEGRD